MIKVKQNWYERYYGKFELNSFQRNIAVRPGRLWKVGLRGSKSFEISLDICQDVSWGKIF